MTTKVSHRANDQLNVFGLISFLCGMVAIFTWGFPYSVAAIITGLAGLKHSGGRDKGLAIAGLTIGVVGVMIFMSI